MNWDCSIHSAGILEEKCETVIAVQFHIRAHPGDLTVVNQNVEPHKIRDPFNINHWVNITLNLN